MGGAERGVQGRVEGTLDERGLPEVFPGLRSRRHLESRQAAHPPSSRRSTTLAPEAKQIPIPTWI